MNKIYSHSVDTLQTINTSKVCSSSTIGMPGTQRVVTNNVTAASDFHSHWTDGLFPHQTDLLEVLYRDEMGRHQSQGPFPLQCSIKHMGSEKKTKKFSKNKQSVKSKNKPHSSPSAHSTTKQIATTLPASHVTSVTVGSNKQRFQTTEDELVFETEASLPLTGTKLPKKSPSLLHRMGLRLKKTVEYIGASNCAFEED
ncbi:vexin [Discoglossus pictus]